MKSKWKNFLRNFNSLSYLGNNLIDDVKIDEYKIDHKRYIRLLSYIMHLYNEEKDRRDVLNNTSKFYMAAQILILTAIGFKAIETEKLVTLLTSIKSYTSNSAFASSIFGILLFSSFIAYLASFVLTVLVNKMWNRERPNDPEKLLSSIGQFPTENQLIAKMVADYAVASNRNHEINNNKAILLRYSLLSFMGSMLLFVISIIYFLTLVYI